MTVPPPLIFLIAGEPSGDVLGARLMAALNERTGGHVRFAGIGGERMAAEGLVSLFPQSELALFGLAELLPRLPNLIRRMNQTVAAVVASGCDALVTVDAPSFNFRVVKRVRKLMAKSGRRPPFIHLVAPTVWAWRPERAKKIAVLYDHLMALLPFEPPWFEREGLPCTFVGHPVVESGADYGNGLRFRAEHRIDDSVRLLVTLPGSRMSEVKPLCADFGETLAILKSRYRTLAVAVPTVPQVAARVRAEVKHWPVPAIVVEGDRAKYDAFAAGEVALAASGTVALELALARLPAVIAYRLHPLTVFLYRRLIKVKYANLVNLMHDRMAVPELLQENCRPEKLAAAVANLLDDPAAREAQIEAYRDVAGWLGGGQGSPSLRSADTVLSVMADHRASVRARENLVGGKRAGGKG